MVCAIWRITGTTEAGWQLSQKEIADLRTKRHELHASVGARVAGVYRPCSGKNTIYVCVYPSLEAIEKFRRGYWSRDGLNAGRYWTYEMDVAYEMPLDT
jgi:hypothetical protein